MLEVAAFPVPYSLVYVWGECESEGQNHTWQCLDASDQLSMDGDHRWGGLPLFSMHSNLMGVTVPCPASAFYIYSLDMGRWWNDVMVFFYLTLFLYQLYCVFYKGFNLQWWVFWYKELFGGWGLFCFLPYPQQCSGATYFQFCVGSLLEELSTWIFSPYMRYFKINLEIKGNSLKGIL